MPLLAEPRAGHFVVAADHPSLPGHFPGDPVVPGVVVLEAAFAALGLPVPASLAEAKFLAPVPPGVEVAVEAVAETGGALRIVCLVAGQPVLRIRLPAGEAG
jgi:3-hydroxymyristoyl/3-hydroxydecanoyl-(acyl carrier protein) dehydratase